MRGKMNSTVPRKSAPAGNAQTSGRVKHGRTTGIKVTGRTEGMPKTHPAGTGKTRVELKARTAGMPR